MCCHMAHVLSCCSSFLTVFHIVQVPALWPPEDYEAHWLMTPDNHIAGIDTTPQHLLLDRWGGVCDEMRCACGAGC